MLQSIGMVGCQFLIDQKRKGGLGFLQPNLGPIFCAKRNRGDLYVGRLELFVMGHNLGHMIATGQSGQVTQEDEQGGLAVSPQRCEGQGTAV